MFPLSQQRQYIQKELSLKNGNGKKAIQSFGKKMLTKVSVKLAKDNLQV